MEAAAVSQCKKDHAWRHFFSWEQGHELDFALPGTSDFSQADGQSSACCVWAHHTGPMGLQASLSLSRLPKFTICITFSRLCDHCRFCSSSKKMDGRGFSPLAGEAAYISRRNNRRSARFASSEFPHRFLLSLLSSLASEDDISTLSSRLSLAFPLPPLLGSSIFHPPWCLPAQRAAPGLSSPKQAFFVSRPVESHRSHLGSVIFFKSQD